MIYQPRHILVFDLETTDVDICKAQPCQFAGLLYKEIDHDEICDFELIKTFNLYIKIDGEMPRGATAVHGLDNNFLDAYGETRPFVAQQFTELKYHQPLLLMGYNIIPYDIPIWFNFVKKHSVQKYPFPMVFEIIDVMALIVSMNPDKKWPKLREACEIYDVPYESEQLHNAVYDCEITWKLYKKLQEVIS